MVFVLHSCKRNEWAFVVLEVWIRLFIRKRLLNLEGSVEFLSENIKNLIETTGYHETSVGIEVFCV